LPGFGGSCPGGFAPSSRMTEQPQIHSSYVEYPQYIVAGHWIPLQKNVNRRRRPSRLDNAGSSSNAQCREHAQCRGRSFASRPVTALLKANDESPEGTEQTVARHVSAVYSEIYTASPGGTAQCWHCALDAVLNPCAVIRRWNAIPGVGEKVVLRTMVEFIARS
jgi:hypothetical protein